MSDITQCRDVNKLNILVKTMLELALSDIKSQGVNPLIVETYRSQERQNYLYCQGRTVDECTVKGINTKFAKTYCNPKASKVTWTLNSVHTSKKAVDVVPQRKIKGKMTAIWNTNDKQTQIIIKTMQKYGFEAGANWTTSPDSPHFQVKGNFTDVFSQKCNTVYVTKAIQKALGITADGIWGANTTKAVNVFRKKFNWSQNGKIGSIALNKLLA